jgi:hypothetical protein
MPSSQESKSRRLAVSGHESLDRATFEMYQAFMAGYVRRINQATFKVAIGGVRIGHAKYSRLAQINLKSRIITFSRYAIENVPERGRRYLVLHELAHVKESSHNNRFWSYVGQFEPDYRKIGQNLENAFKRNVTDSQRGGQQSSRIIANFALHQRNKDSQESNKPVLIHSAPHINIPNTGVETDTTGSAVIVKPHPHEVQALGNCDPSVTTEDQAEAQIWEEIAEEFTYWRDDSDEDSDVDMSGSEYEDNAGSFEDCDD